ncbi:hypothetical protein [Brucella tritici]|jgi:hypothetical protein|uniref:hypothetical protein n=1 Tax=Brucella tritici TaxID=94626 RepID=UPI002001D806|nr:hypothetical protein [Brucella tritici]
MPIGDDEWHKLANGWYADPVSVLRISPNLSVRLGVATTLVFVRPEYVQKIRFKHSIEPRHFEHLPTMVSSGTAYLDHRTKNTIQIIYVGNERTFRLVLKGIPDKNEIWISTFHTIGPKELKRRLKRMGSPIK